MAKGSSEYAAWLDGRRSPVNTGAPLPGVDQAQERVLHYQRKLHVWASSDAERRFCDLWNLVCDPATLVVAWSRVSRNRGSRTAGVDAATRRHVEAFGVERFLAGLRGELRAGTFRPLPVRERMIPKRDGRKRRLGIPTLKDRVVQMALMLEEVGRRIADRRVLALVRSFLRAGPMTETGRLQRTVTGTPQGGIASPLLA